MPAMIPTPWIKAYDPAQEFLAGHGQGVNIAEANARSALAAQQMQQAAQQHALQMQQEQQRLDAARVKAQQDYELDKQRMEITKSYYDQSMGLRKQEIIENQERIKQAAEIAKQRWDQQKEFQLMVERLRLQGQESLADRQIKAQEAYTTRAAKVERDKALLKIIDDAGTAKNKLQADYTVERSASKKAEIKAQMDEQERIINNAMKQVDPSLLSLYGGGATDVVLENGKLVFKDPSKRKAAPPTIPPGATNALPPQASLPLGMQGLNILNPAGWAVPDLEKLARSPAWSPTDEEESPFDVTGWRNPTF